MNVKYGTGGKKLYGHKCVLVETPSILSHIGKVVVSSGGNVKERDITGRITIMPLSDINDLDNYTVGVKIPDSLWTEENYDKYFKDIYICVKT